MTENDENELFRPPVIKEGYIPYNAIMVVVYVDPEGDLSYSTHVRGTMTTTSALGFLEVAKYDILTKKAVND